MNISIICISLLVVSVSCVAKCLPSYKIILYSPEASRGEARSRGYLLSILSPAQVLSQHGQSIGIAFLFPLLNPLPIALPCLVHQYRNSTREYSNISLCCWSSREGAQLQQRSNPGIIKSNSRKKKREKLARWKTVQARWEPRVNGENKKAKR